MVCNFPRRAHAVIASLLLYGTQILDSSPILIGYLIHARGLPHRGDVDGAIEDWDVTDGSVHKLVATGELRFFCANEHGFPSFAESA